MLNIKLKKKHKKHASGGGKNISVKLIITLTALLVLLLAQGSIALYSQHTLKTEVVEQWKKDAVELAEEAAKRAENADAWLHTMEEVTENKIEDVGKMVALLDKIDNQSISLLAEEIDVSEINYVENGEIVYSNLPDNIGYIYPDDHPLKTF